MIITLSFQMTEVKKWGGGIRTFTPFKEMSTFLKYVEQCLTG